MDKLLKALEDDCTLSSEQLAAITGDTAENVRKKIKKAEDDKTILGYKAVIDWDKTDRDDVTALIEVNVTPQIGDGIDRIAERIYQYDEVESCYLMSGSFDMTVIISGHSLKEVATFVGQKLATIEGVTGTSTHFILKKYKERHLVFKKTPAQEEGFVFS